MRVCLVGDERDALIVHLERQLGLREIPFERIAVDALADVRVSIDAEGVVLNDTRPSALVFRPGAHGCGGASFSSSFALVDRPFCDAECRAVWLAILNTPGLVCFNRLNAVAWFESEHWTVWRRLIQARAIGLVPFTFGYCNSPELAWLPYSASSWLPDPGERAAAAIGAARSARRLTEYYLVACGRILEAPSGASEAATVSVSMAAGALADAGALLCEVWADAQGRIGYVDTHPGSSNERDAELLAVAILDALAGCVGAVFGAREHDEPPRSVPCAARCQEANR